jgi:hypothetical protein
MQRAIELSVAAAVEPVAPLLARAGLERGDAGMAERRRTLGVVPSTIGTTAPRKERKALN